MHLNTCDEVNTCTYSWATVKLKIKRTINLKSSRVVNGVYAIQCSGQPWRDNLQPQHNLIPEVAAFKWAYSPAVINCDNNEDAEGSWTNPRLIYVRKARTVNTQQLVLGFCLLFFTFSKCCHCLLNPFKAYNLPAREEFSLPNKQQLSSKLHNSKMYQYRMHKSLTPNCHSTQCHWPHTL